LLSRVPSMPITINRSLLEVDDRGFTTDESIKSRVLIMQLEYFTSKWSEYARWFYYKPWERYELLSLGLIVAALIMIIVRGRKGIRRVRKSVEGRAPENFRGL